MSAHFSTLQRVIVDWLVSIAVTNIFWLDASTISNQIKRLRRLNLTAILKALLQEGGKKSRRTILFFSIRLAHINVYLHVENATSARLRGSSGFVFKCKRSLKLTR